MAVDSAIGESAVIGLKKGAETRFHFADEKNPKITERALVYLHGFSASPREASPLAERLAKEWKANLFLPRFRGHGIFGSDGLAGVALEDWQKETAESLAIARKLGKKVVVIAMSTAAPIAAAELLRDNSQVEAFVMISPNFGLPQWSSELLLFPGGKWLARQVLGEYREWKAKNEAQAFFWTTKYPSTLAVEVMRAVDLGRKAELERLHTPTLMLYCPSDSVVDAKAAIKQFARIGAKNKAIESINSMEDNHVIAGQILAPITTETVLASIRDFVRTN